jgi:antitoxin component of RelBE/YafQ-DinJ toxin-antitoxin module
VLEKLNITPTEAVRLLFQYVAETGAYAGENGHHQRQ